MGMLTRRAGRAIFEEAFGIKALIQHKFSECGKRQGNAIGLRLIAATPWLIADPDVSLQPKTFKLPAVIRRMTKPNAAKVVPDYALAVEPSAGAWFDQRRVFTSVAMNCG